VLKVSLPMGYGAVLGMCPTVAEGGFVLGGGWGALSRKHGLGLDNLLSANVVLASSQLVKANSTHNSDLFWALRGAGIGNFGVVTEMTYRLHPAQETTIMGLLRMPAVQAPLFLQRICHGNVAREFTMILEANPAMNNMSNHTFSMQPLKPMSNPISFVVMWSCPEANCIEFGRTYLRDEIASLVDDTQLMVHEFNWLKNPAYSHVLPNTNLVQCFTGFLNAENATLRNLQVIVNTYSEWIAEMSPYVTADVEFWAGRISEISPEETAFPHRNTVYNLGLLVQVPSDQPAKFKKVVRRMEREWPRLSKFLDGSYVNYPMASLDVEEYEHVYWGPHVQRLRQVKRKYDPDNLFWYPQGIRI